MRQRETDELGEGGLEPATRRLCERAASRGAPAVEAYPVDPGGRRTDTTMAFVGTRVMVERAGFEVVGETEATASSMTRLVMRRTV